MSKSETVQSKSALFNRIATELFEVEQILEEISTRKHAQLASEGEADFSVSAVARQAGSRTSDFVAPRNSVEETVAGLCCEIFGIEQIGIYDNFFELGAHSLQCVQIVSRLHDMFHVELPLLSILEEPTVAGLVKAIEQYQIEQASAEEIAAILKELDELSDDEVEAFLATTDLS